MTGGPAGAEALHGELVQAPRPLAPAEHEEHGIVVEVEAGACVFRRERRAGDARDRPAGDAVLRALPAPDREGQEHAARERRGQPVRQPEVRVGLHQRGGNPLSRGGEHHRARDVAASAEHDVGRAPLQDLAARADRAGRAHHGADLRDPWPTRQPRDVERVELEARLGDELRLKPLGGPGERHGRAAFAQRFAHGQRRKYVSGCPAGRDQAPRRVLSVDHRRRRC